MMYEIQTLHITILCGFAPQNQNYNIIFNFKQYKWC